MTATRSTQEEKRYKRYLKHHDGICPFCESASQTPALTEESTNFLVVKNSFPYSIWDGQSVKEHLMVVPRKHTDSLAGLSLQQSKEYLDILRKYEESGYNIYTRSLNSTTRSITHHHTHLIKTNHKTHKLLILARWPFYIRGSL